VADKPVREDDRGRLEGSARRSARRRRGGQAVGVAIALFTLVAFGSGLWFAYDRGVRKGVALSPPLIKAPEGPYKVPPENPGGLVVPNQDKLIYDRLSRGAPPPKVERLLPPPERAAPEPPPERSGSGAALPGAPSPAETSAGPRAPESAERTGAVPGGDAAMDRIAAAQNALAPAAARPDKAAPTPTRRDQGRDEGAQPAPTSPGKADTPPRGGGAGESPPAPNTAAPVRSATTGGDRAYRIQLAAFRNFAAAEKGWRRLSKAHEKLLTGLSPVIERADLGPGKGVFFRLQAGPLSDRAAAAALCAKLKARKQGCLVVAP